MLNQRNIDIKKTLQSVWIVTSLIYQILATGNNRYIRNTKNKIIFAKKFDDIFYFATSPDLVEKNAWKYLICLHKYNIIMIF